MCIIRQVLDSFPILKIQIMQGLPNLLVFQLFYPDYLNSYHLEKKSMQCIILSHFI
jgi:hypothetical protein